MYSRTYQCNKCNRKTTKYFRDGARSKHSYPHHCGGQMIKLWPEAEKTKKTDRQKAMLELLNSKVTFLPTSYDKRFVRNINSLNELTEKQSAYLEKVFHKYRRQIPDHEELCSICEGKQLELF